MAKIKLFTRNILETATVTMTGSPDSGYPLSRLYDRSKNFYWKDTVEEAKTLLVNQGASSILDADFLAIMSHNFDGETLSWDYSTDNSSWGTAQTWSQSGTSQIIKTLSAALTKQYWRLTLTSMVNPQCAEVFMSEGYEFKVDFSGAPSKKPLINVERELSLGGVGFTTKLGEKRRTAQYTLFLEGTDITNFDDAMDDLDDYSKPFFVKDLDDNYWLATLADSPEMEYITDGGHYLVDINLIEEL